MAPKLKWTSQHHKGAVKDQSCLVRETFLSDILYP